MRRSKGGREADVFIPPGYKAGDGVKQAAEITNTDGRTCNLYLGEGRETGGWRLVWEEM